MPCWARRGLRETSRFSHRAPAAHCSEMQHWQANRQRYSSNHLPMYLRLNLPGGSPFARGLQFAWRIIGELRAAFGPQRMPAPTNRSPKGSGRPQDDISATGVPCYLVAHYIALLALLGALTYGAVPLLAEPQARGRQEVLHG